MLSFHQNRHNRLNDANKKAFTLTELLIVLLIIAILMAMILPRFFGARRNAGDRVAQQTLEVAARDAAATATDIENFSRANAAGLEDIEGDITFVGGTTVAPKEGNKRGVSVGLSGANLIWTGAAVGEANGCWFIRLHLDLDGDNEPLPTEYAFEEDGTCSATNFPSGAVTSGFPSR